MGRMMGLAGVGLVLVGSMACTTKSASDYTTSEIWADISATASSEVSTSVAATFRENATSLTFIQLTSDDKLTATTGANTQTLQGISLLGLVSYSTNFGVGAAETPFTVSLARTKDQGATNTQLSLPVPFTLSSLNATSFSRASDIQVAWTSALNVDTMKLKVTGSCLDTYTADLAAQSTFHIISGNSLRKRTPANNNDNVPDECDATITVTRTRSGSLDSHFKGGTAVAAQERTLSFRSKL